MTGLKAVITIGYNQDIVSYHKVAIHKGSKIDIQRTITHPNRYFKGVDVAAFNYDPAKLYKYLYDPFGRRMEE